MKSYKQFNLRRKALAVVVAAAFSAAQANPVSPTVVHGMATFNQQGSLYTITNTPNTIIDWRSFSINPGEITRFVQQSADSKVLNRITGQDPSMILGSLQSNGKVFLINPNGVIFGAGSRVDVGGLVASSLNISNADFLAGKNNFDGAATAGKVSNQGTITTPAGGQIFLVAPAVENSGIISTAGGEVVLAAGHSVQLFDSADPNVQVVVSSPADQAINLGQIVAAGGRVGVYGALVNQRGVINADSATVGASGKIVLKSSKTTLLEAGSVTSARGAAAGSNLNTGGDIMVLGPQVGLTGNAAVDASGGAGGGTVLVGGDYQGKNAAVMNAQQSYVGQDVVIKADATVNGDGGKVIVWSDQATRMYGAISARGGAQGGNGGFVETSGHYLDMQGKVDTRAPRGASGRLLLDPSDVYLDDDLTSAVSDGMQDSGELSGNSGLFVDVQVVADSLVRKSVLLNSLDTTDVIISTSNGKGIGQGHIKLGSLLQWNSKHTLTLNADGDIGLNAAINAPNAAVHLNAGGAIVQSTSPTNALNIGSLDAVAAGAITLDNSANSIAGAATLKSTGGNVTLTAASVNLGNTSASGSLTATASTGDLTVSGNVSAGGKLTLATGSAGHQIGIVSGNTVASSGGDILLQADSMSLNGAISGVTQHEVRLLPFQDATNILIGGSAADSSGTLGLSQAELQRISVPANGLLTIGTSFSNSAAAGTLTVDGSLNLASSLGGGNMLLQTQAGALSVNSGAALSVPAALNLQTVSTGSSRITNAGSVSAASGINLQGGKMTLAGGSMTAPTISLSTNNDVNLGAGSDLADTLVLGSADLNRLNTSALYVSSGTNGNGGGNIVASTALTVTPGLTLTAQRAIDLQASLNVGKDLSLSASGAITASGDVRVSGAFTLQSGSWTQNSASLPALSATDFKLNGGSFLRVSGGDGSASSPYQLADVYGLQGAATQASSNSYVLVKDIDASATAGWSGGFQPLASSGYSGVFDGASHTISGLTISRSGDTNVGLFASVAGGTIKDLTLSAANVRGNTNVGALAGDVSNGAGAISNVQVSGTVTGVSNVGGLAGNSGGKIASSGASGAVYGLSGYNSSNIGGLVGRNTGQVSDSSSSASVSNTGDGYTGGLVGSNTRSGDYAGAVTRSYATGAVYSSGEIVGGLVGDNNGGSISLSYASGNVSGGRNAGGLVGRNISGASISNAYATGNVSGNSDSGNVSHGDIGGLIGDLYDGSVSNVYSSGTVNGAGFYNVYGAVGAHEGGTLSNAYFNQDAAGTMADAAGAQGLSAADMQQQSSYAGFDFSATWRNYDGHTAPLLKTFLTPLTVAITGGDSVTKTYDGQSTTFSGTSGSLPAGVSGTLGFGGAVNVGTYQVGGLWSTQYDISYTGSSAQLVIQPRTVNATLSASKTYDGTAALASGQYTTSFSNLVSGDALGVMGAIQFNDKNAGSKTLVIGEVGLSNNSHGNYVLGTVSGSGTISPATLEINGLSVNSRVYDGTTAAALSGTAGVKALGADVVSLGGSGTASFDNKNVGSGKLVTVNIGGYTLSGADAGNYVLAAPSGLTGEITAAQLSINGLSANSRVYNLDYDAVSGTYGRLATVSGGVLSGVIVGDQVGIGSINATFADKNVGTAKAVTVNGITLSGADAGNYTVASYPALSANITPATLTVTLASREYNNSTAGSFSNATLGGVLSTSQGTSDMVSLVSNGATASYSDKNVGKAKTVTVGGTPLSLGGTDAGNYVLSTSVTGDITVRPLATWTGTSGGLWSNAANWADGVAPDGANVTAASLGSGGAITYDATAGTTTLATLSSSGTGLTLSGGKLVLTGSGDTASSFNGALAVSGGTLELQGQLYASKLVLSSGLLYGSSTSSQLAVSSLNQTSGNIDSNGSVSIGNGGDIAVGNVRAHALVLNAAEGGTISQTGQLVADTLDASATGNITLGNSNNHVGAFSANVYGNGNISFFNTVTSGELALGALNANGNIVIDNHGGIHTTEAIHASAVGAGTGLVSITAHSPVTIGSSISGTDIQLAASTDITLTGSSMLTSSHSIALTAGNNIVLGGALSVPAGGSISATATNGNISTASGTQISSGGAPVTLSAPNGSVTTTGGQFIGGTPTINDGAAAAAAAQAAAAQAAADAAAKAAADAAAQAAADAAAKAAADAAAKAAADAAAKAAADAAAKAAADAAAKAAADAAAKAAADAAAKAAADAAAKAAADATAKAAADAAAKAAADAAAKAAADAAAKAAADAAAKAAADAAAQAAADAAAKAAAAGQGDGNQPVTQALNSTVNVINHSVTGGAQQFASPSTDIPAAGGSVPRAGGANSANGGPANNAVDSLPIPGPGSVGTGPGPSSGNSAPDDKVPGDRNPDSLAQKVSAKEPVKKMYCN